MATTTTPGLRVVRAMCPMNCHPTLCAMLVEVADGRLVGLRGDPDNPDSQGFLCQRGQASRKIIGNPHRLRPPLVRARRGADQWRQATWDEALDLIAARMRAAGGEAVGLWTGHGLAATNYGMRISDRGRRGGKLCPTGTPGAGERRGPALHGRGDRRSQYRWRGGFRVVLAITAFPARGRTSQEIDVVRASGGQVIHVAPDEESRQAMGHDLSDSRRARAAAGAGARQAAEVAQALRNLWTRR